MNSAAPITAGLTEQIQKHSAQKHLSALIATVVTACPFSQFLIEPNLPEEQNQVFQDCVGSLFYFF